MVETLAGAVRTGKDSSRILFTGSLHPAYELKMFREMINKINNVKCVLTLWISANRALNNYAQYGLHRMHKCYIYFFF